MALKFDILATDGQARAGVLRTSHGNILTPTITTNFTPALLRSGLSPGETNLVGTQLILVNVFHSYIAGVQSIHQELGWNGPVVSDSGGFQMVSLADRAKVHWRGVRFFWNDKWYNFIPEEIIQLQKDMGVDIIMPLDRVTPVLARNPLLFWNSVLTTMRWFNRSYKLAPHHTFYIVQGGLNYLARRLSLWDANRRLSNGTPGVAIGGLAGGEDRQAMYQMVRFCTDRLPASKPRHLFGVGTPVDLLECIERGVDIFDCVAHTREARHSRVWTANGVFELKYMRHADDHTTIETSCDCPACSQGITRADLIRDISHYSRSDSDERKERRMQAWHHCMLHNIRFVAKLMEQSRRAIQAGEFQKFKQEFLEHFQAK